MVFLLLNLNLGFRLVQLATIIFLRLIATLVFVDVMELVKIQISLFVLAVVF